MGMRIEYAKKVENGQEMSQSAKVRLKLSYKYTGYVNIVLYIIAITCQSLSEPQNGGVQFTSLVKGSIASYSCSDGFKLIGEVNRQCLVTGQWSGEEPTCYRKLPIN